MNRWMKTIFALASLTNLCDSMIAMSRPKFLPSLLEAWLMNLREEGAISLVPYWMIGAGAVGASIAWSLPSTFWDGQKPEVPFAALSGVLTLNGLILALSWSAFSKIYEVVGAGQFCNFLRRNQLLNHYLLFVSYAHSAQIVAIAASAFALFSVALPFLPWVMKAAVAVSIATTAYAIKQGVGASMVMNDLIWQKSEFDSAQPKPAVQQVQQQ